MKKLILLLALLAGCTSFQLPEEPRKDIPRQVTPGELISKTVALVDQDGEGVDAYCSGVWVEKTTIVTALHCMGESKVGDHIGYVVKSDVYSGGDLKEHPVTPRKARLMPTDPLHDLALLADYAPTETSLVLLEALHPGRLASSAPLILLLM